MDRPSNRVLARMPLAEAVLLLWRWVTCEERMSEVWQRHRGRCYEKIISFSQMVHLIADALLQYKGSARRSFEKGIENGELEATFQAAYKKMSRLPVAVSQAFLAHGTAVLLPDSYNGALRVPKAATSPGNDCTTYTQLIRIRIEHPALRSTNFFPPLFNHPDGYSAFPDRDVVVFNRYGSATGSFERFIIVINYSDFDLRVDIPFSLNGLWDDLLNGDSVSAQHFRLLDQEIKSNWTRIYHRQD